MVRIALLAALAMCVSACGRSAAPTSIGAAPQSADSGLDTTPSGIESLRFTTSYGECAGFCWHSLLVSPDGSSLRSALNGGDNAPAVDEAVELDPAVRAQILAAATEATSNPWDARYGCPDCGDQGAYDLVVSAGGAARETVIDPLQHPSFFDPLLDAVLAVLAAHPGPTSICAVAPGNCTVGQVSLVLGLGADGALVPTWYNDMDHSVFLAGCTTVTFERLVGGAVAWSGPAAICVWEGTARVLGFHDLLTDFGLGTQGKPGTYRATGTYSEGCTSGQPLSQAGCTATTSVTSNSVVVTE